MWHRLSIFLVGNHIGCHWWAANVPPTISVHWLWQCPESYCPWLVGKKNDCLRHWSVLFFNVCKPFARSWNLCSICVLRSGTYTSPCTLSLWRDRCSLYSTFLLSLFLVSTLVISQFHHLQKSHLEIRWLLSCSWCLPRFIEPLPLLHICSLRLVRSPYVAPSLRLLTIPYHFIPPCVL